MINRKQRSRSRQTHCFSRALRHELLECRNLMAGDIVDTPTDAFIELSSGQAEVRASLDFEGDVDALRLDVSTYDSFAAGAWKTNGESLKIRVLDATGQDIADTVVDSSGVISLVGSATGAYSLAVSSDTNEVADYIVRVKAWTEGGWTTLPETDDADGRKDPSGGDPEVGIPDGSGGDTPDRGPGEDSDIRIVLRDGVYYFEDDVRRASGDSASAKDPVVDTPDGLGAEPEMADARGPEQGSDIRIDLRDGVYYYEDEVKRPAGDSPSSDGSGAGEGGGQLIEVSLPRSKHNAASPADVDGDTRLTPLDALGLINLLNQYGGGDVASVGALSAQAGGSQDDMFIDTNDDGFISPLDVLFVINQLNNQAHVTPGAAAVAEGERNALASDAAVASMMTWTSMTDDEDELGLFSNGRFI